jgi:glucose-6-phosphate 1-dehydrogenase
VIEKPFGHSLDSARDWPWQNAGKFKQRHQAASL